MDLTSWLVEQKIKRTDFAARIDVSPSYVTALCNGSVWPGREVMERINLETAGAVTPNDFLGLTGDELPLASGGR